MTDKELQRLTRSELLELLIKQTEEKEKLRSRLEQTEAQLKDRQIEIEKAGSIAEAALALSGIFQAAQSAADQYLENIQRLSGNQDEICRDLQAKAEMRASEIIDEAQKYSQKAHTEADAYWKEVIAKATVLINDHDALRETVQSARTGLNEKEN